jgi:hypothetical protein
MASKPRSSTKRSAPPASISPAVCKGADRTLPGAGEPVPAPGRSPQLTVQFAAAYRRPGRPIRRAPPPVSFSPPKRPDLGARCADVDVGDATVAALNREKLFGARLSVNSEDDRPWGRRCWVRLPRVKTWDVQDGQKFPLYRVPVVLGPCRVAHRESGPSFILPHGAFPPGWPVRPYGRSVCAVLVDERTLGLERIADLKLLVALTSRA